MVNKLKEMSYGAARYIVLKELDERDSIGRLLLKYDRQLTINMMDYCDWIDKADISIQSKKLYDINWQKAVDIPKVLIHIGQRFPFLVLQHSELDWTAFISAWVRISEEFIGIIEHYISLRDLKEEEISGLRQIIAECRSAIEPTITLVNLGVGYMDLIAAGRELVNEMQQWQQSQPAALRLSNAYLQSLGVIKPEE